MRLRSATCSCSCPASAGFATPSTRSTRFGPKGYELLPLYARLTTARQRRDPRAGQGAAHRARDQHRRDVVDGAADPLRHRFRARARQPLRYAASRAEFGRGADRAGERDPARGPLRPSRARHLRAAVLRGGFRGAARVHGARDPAHGARRRACCGSRRCGSGPIDEFPFIDAPPAKAVADAYQLLHLLGAVDDERRLTKDGELMARLPVDPRVARLLVVANKNDALREGLVIAAALSVVDPREYGVDADAARRKHEAFADARSEFTSYLNLWTAYRHERRGGERALRKWARIITCRRRACASGTTCTISCTSSCSACVGARGSRRPTTAPFTRPCSRRSSISSPSTTTGSSTAACASRARSSLPARRSRRSGRAGSWPPSASRRSASICAPWRR